MLNAETLRGVRGCAVGWSIAWLFVVGRHCIRPSDTTLDGVLTAACLVLAAVAVAIGHASAWSSLVSGRRARVAIAWGLAALGFLFTEWSFGRGIGSVTTFLLPRSKPELATFIRLPDSIGAFLVWPAFAFLAGAFAGFSRGRGARLIQAVLGGFAWAVGVSCGGGVAFLAFALSAVALWSQPEAVRVSGWLVMAAISGFMGGATAGLIGRVGDLDALA
jgi:hypothetical protein